MQGCLLNAKIDPGIVVECYRAHSNCLADTCQYSDAPTAETAGYPIQSDANRCFIRCRQNVLECLEANPGSSDCDLPFPGCMHDCLPDDPADHPPEQADKALLVRQAEGDLPTFTDPSLPDCSGTSECFKSCDPAAKACILTAGRDAAKAKACWEQHDRCALVNCKCDSYTGDGYHVFSTAGICLSKAQVDYRDCKGDTCAADFVAKVETCLPSTDLAKRQAPHITLTLFEGTNGDGNWQDHTFVHDLCNDFVWDNPDNFNSIKMKPGVECYAYTLLGCYPQWNTYDHCPRRDSEYACGFNLAKAKLRSMRCNWPVAALRKAAEVSVAKRRPDHASVDRPLKESRAIVKRDEWTETFSFDVEEPAPGTSKGILMNNGGCQNIQRFGSDKFATIKMKPFSECYLHTQSDCAGGPETYDLCVKLRFGYACDFIHAKHKLVSIRCSWDKNSGSLDQPPKRDSDLARVKRDDWTESLMFYEGKDATGNSQGILMTNGECQNIQWFRSERFNSMKLPHGRTCELHSESNCAPEGARVLCEGPAKENSCNFGSVAGKLVSVRCKWPKSKTVVARHASARTKTFKLFHERGLLGRADEVVFEAKACKDVRPLHPENWRSVEMLPGHNCTIFNDVSCKGVYAFCEGLPGCNIDQTNGVLQSMQCNWPDNSEQMRHEVAVKRAEDVAIGFFSGKGATGTKTDIMVSYGVCKTWDVSTRYSSMLVQPGEKCTLYQLFDCKGGSTDCTADFGRPVACDIRPRPKDIKLNYRSMLCTRVAAKREVQTIDAEAGKRGFLFYESSDTSGPYDEIFVEQKNACNAVDFGTKYNSMLVGTGEVCIGYEFPDCSGRRSLTCLPHPMSGNHCPINVDWGFKGLRCSWPGTDRAVAEKLQISSGADGNEITARGAIAERQTIPTKVIEFYLGPDGTGAMKPVTVQFNRCQDGQALFVNPGQVYKSITLEAGEWCYFYDDAGCPAAQDAPKIYCETRPGSGAKCNLTRPLKSFVCAWSPTAAQRSTIQPTIEEKRQIASTRSIEFYTEVDGGGSQKLFVVPKQKCQAASIGSDFKSMYMHLSEVCTVYSNADCTGCPAIQCGQVGKAVMCNFRQGQTVVGDFKSIYCWWP